jgi:hypothetical protein
MGWSDRDLTPGDGVSVEAALGALVHEWWDVVGRLDDHTAAALSTLVADLPERPADIAVVGADAVALVLPALPPDHPVAVAAREDSPRHGSPSALPIPLDELRSLGAFTNPVTTEELSRLNPQDVAIAAGLTDTWRAGAPVTPAVASHLAELARIVARIRLATGAHDMATWFVSPVPRLEGRTPCNVASAGELDRLADLAAALETFTPS